MMKLGELKSKIRGTKGSPTLKVELTPGCTVELALMKGPLMEALDTAFPGGKSVETGLVMDDAGVIGPIDGGTYGLKLARAPLLDIMEATGLDVMGPAKAGKTGNVLDMAAAKPATTGLPLDLDDEPAAPAPSSSLLLDL